MALSQLTQPNNLNLYSRSITADTINSQTLNFTDSSVENLSVVEALKLGDGITTNSGILELLGGFNGGVSLEASRTGAEYSLILPPGAPDIGQVLKIESYSAPDDKYITVWGDQVAIPSDLDSLTVNDTLRIGDNGIDGKLELASGNGLSVILKASDVASQSYAIMLPEVEPLAGQLLQVVGINGDNFVTTWVSAPTSIEELKVGSKLIVGDSPLSRGTVEIQSQTGSLSLEAGNNSNEYTLQFPTSEPTLNQVLKVVSNNTGKYQTNWADETPILPPDYVYPNVVFQNVESQLIALNSTPQKVLGVSITPKIANTKFKITTTIYTTTVSKTVDINAGVSLFYSVYKDGVDVSPASYMRNNYAFG
jgi:hypothetical protein